MNTFISWKEWSAIKREKRRAKALSNEIDRQLEEESKQVERQQNILLISIPAAEAEAFAIVKHMKFDHCDYTSEQLADFRSLIWKILLENARGAVRALRALKAHKHANLATKANCEYIMNHKNDTDDPEFVFLPRFTQVVQDLWTEEIVPLLHDRPTDPFPLADNAEYFFAEAQRISREEYVPSIEDIGHASEKGVMETHINFNGLLFRILQVYGQHGNPKKWIYLFEGVTSVIFCALLSDYDEPGVSRRSRRTRLIESLILFEAIVKSPCFSRASIILLLTGMDEFRAKLHEVPLNEYFPEYTGGTDANAGARCIRTRFLELNCFRLQVHSHIAEVSNVHEIRIITSAVRDTIFRNSLIAVDLM